MARTPQYGYGAHGAIAKGRKLTSQHKCEIFECDLVCCNFMRRRYDGQWVKNCMQGNGRFVWKDGRAYVGQSLQHIQPDLS
eukprot:6468307-Amphidinium_carterae.1